MRWLDDITKLNVHESEQTLGNSEGQGSLPRCSTGGCRVGHDLATEQQIKVILCVFFRNSKDINWMPLTLHLGTGVLTWFGCLKAPQIRGGMGNTPGLLQLLRGAEMGTQRQVRVAPSGTEPMEPGRGLRGALAARLPGVDRDPQEHTQSRALGRVLQEGLQQCGYSREIGAQSTTMV